MEGVVLGADSREGVAPPGLQVEREEHPPPLQPPSNLPKVAVIRAVPSCRNAVSWDTIIAPKADWEGEKKNAVGANERKEVDWKTA